MRKPRPTKKLAAKPPNKRQRRAAFQTAMYNARKDRKARYAAPGGHGN